MGIISRYFMTEINLERTKSLSKCAAEWATNLITFGRLMSQGPGILRGLQTNAQMTQCASENSILIDFTCAKICGSWGERGCRDLFVSPHWERLSKKHGWYKVPFQILAWGLGVNGEPSRSRSLSWLQTLLHGALRSCCRCVKSLYRR